jgi:PKD repeat protein
MRIKYLLYSLVTLFTFTSCLIEDIEDPLKVEDNNGGGTNGVNFYANKTDLGLGETVYFYNSSRSDYYYFYWEFGDGHISSSENPTHVYDDPGTYTVSLYAYNETEGNVETKYDYITVVDYGGGEGPLQADFYASATNVSIGESITFTSTSTGYADSYEWDFGDGTNIVGNYSNTTHTYYEAGTYTVSLTVYDPNLDSDTEIKYNYIVVEAGGSSSYCTSYGANSTYEWINRFSIGSFSFTSGNDSGYGDHTDNLIILQTGQSNYIYIEPGYYSSTYTEYFRVWIDFNNDGDFGDSGELIASGNADGSVEGNISIPPYSGTTRLRVSMSRYSYVDPCSVFSYGEVEDYTVVLGSKSATNNSDSKAIDLKPISLKKAIE